MTLSSEHVKQASRHVESLSLLARGQRIEQLNVSQREIERFRIGGEIDPLGHKHVS